MRIPSLPKVALLTLVGAGFGACSPRHSSSPVELSSPQRVGSQVSPSGSQERRAFVVAPFIAVAGVQEFTSRLIVRPAQLDALSGEGQTRLRLARVRSAARRMLARYDVLDRVPQTDEYIIRVPVGSNEQQVADELMASGAFEYVEPDWLLFPTGMLLPPQQGTTRQVSVPSGLPVDEESSALCPDDSLFSSQWHHKRIRSCGGWTFDTGGPSITIGVCDTGIRTTHEDLQLHRLEGYNAVDRLWESEGGDIGPRNSHGTKTTGTAAANGNNTLGVSGVGWNLSHRMLRVSNLSNGSAMASVIQHAARTSIENGDRIASISYHGASIASNGTTATYIKSLGGLMLWGSGNTSSNFSSPGRDADDLIVVGATDQDDARASFSSYGKFVDLFAPGTAITTSDAANDMAYTTVQGTSYACPMTAGVCALIWSQRPGLSPSDVERILKESADDIGLPGVDDVFGYGRINLRNALAHSGTTVPAASFTHQPGSGLSPLAVSFRDQSIGVPTTWAWDFGDGETSTLQNPVHSYTTSGAFTVALTVGNAEGSDTFTMVNAILVDIIPPVAGFSATPTAGLAPMTVDFLDESTGGVPNTWLWDFGDGTTSVLQSPSHTYTMSGVYDVSLDVGNSYGSDILTITAFITVDFIPPLAGFRATPLSGASPLVVDFSDESTAGTATAWAWSFGDGQSSTAQSPSHTYTVAGTYNVSLTASNAYGSDTLLKIGYVSILPGPTILANFVGAPRTGTAPLQVDFIDLSIGNIVLWEWDFGDGTKSNQQHPSHIYTTPSEYDVHLTVTTALGKDSSLEVGKYVVVQ